MPSKRPALNEHKFLSTVGMKWHSKHSSTIIVSGFVLFIFTFPSSFLFQNTFISSSSSSKLSDSKLLDIFVPMSLPIFLIVGS
jgi:hypothetical protein